MQALWQERDVASKPGHGRASGFICASGPPAWASPFTSAAPGSSVVDAAPASPMLPVSALTPSPSPEASRPEAARSTQQMSQHPSCTTSSFSVLAVQSLKQPEH